MTTTIEDAPTGTGTPDPWRGFHGQGRRHMIDCRLVQVLIGLAA